MPKYIYSYGPPLLHEHCSNSHGSNLTIISKDTLQRLSLETTHFLSSNIHITAKQSPLSINSTPKRVVDLDFKMPRITSSQLNWLTTSMSNSLVAAEIIEQVLLTTDLDEDTIERLQTALQFLQSMPEGAVVDGSSDGSSDDSETNEDGEEDGGEGEVGNGGQSYTQTGSTGNQDWYDQHANIYGHSQG